MASLGKKAMCQIGFHHQKSVRQFQVIWLKQRMLKQPFFFKGLTFKLWIYHLSQGPSFWGIQPLESTKLLRCCIRTCLPARALRPPLDRREGMPVCSRGMMGSKPRGVIPAIGQDAMIQLQTALRGFHIFIGKNEGWVSPASFLVSYFN